MQDDSYTFENVKRAYQDGGPKLRAHNLARASGLKVAVNERCQHCRAEFNQPPHQRAPLPSQRLQQTTQKLCFGRPNLHVTQMQAQVVLCEGVVEHVEEAAGSMAAGQFLQQLLIH